MAVIRMWRRLAADEERVRGAIAVTMAILTLAAAGVAFLQGGASARSNQANRTAEVIGEQAVGEEVGRQFRAIADYGVFRRWAEQIYRSAGAYNQLVADPDAEGAALYGALTAVESDLSEWVRQQSILTQPPYFDEETFLVDIFGYEAVEKVAPAIEGVQRREAELAVADQWSTKAASYVTILTLLAVALFFLGLAASLGRSSRPYLAGMGAALGLLALGWTAAVAVTDVHRTPDDAIEQVVVAYRELAQGASSLTELTEENREHNLAAVEAADQAVAADPVYAEAQLIAAETRIALATAQYLGPDGPDGQTQGLLDGADAAMVRYLALRPDDYSAWWNLGWARLLGGDAAGSLSATDEATALSPDHFTLYLNRALARLRGGDLTAATADVEVALEVAHATDLDSNASFFVVADRNIGRLAELWPEEADALTEMQRRLREGQVALRVLGAPVPQAPGVTLEDVSLSVLRLAETGELEEGTAVADGDSISASGAHGLRLSLPRPAPGGTLSVELWRNGFRDAGYAQDVDLAGEGATLTLDLLSPYGQAGSDLDPGAYELELYLDGTTVTHLSWEVVSGS